MAKFTIQASGAPQASPTTVYEIPSPVWYDGTPTAGVSALPDTGIGSPGGGWGWAALVVVLAFVVVGFAVLLRRRANRSI